MPNSLQLRAASLAPTTFNADDNTIEVVISTGADVQRAGFIERLPVANADLRNIAGAPVLDAHNQGSTRAVLGVIQKAWRKDGEIRALLKLSSRDDVAGLVQDIKDGIVRNLSVGYRVSRWADSTDSKGNRIRTAVAWAIHEASFVPISNTLSAEWFEQLTSERRVLRYTRGQPVRLFERIMGRRAEALDCVVYALAVRNLVKVDLERRGNELRGVTEAPKIPTVVRSRWMQRGGR